MFKRNKSLFEQLVGWDAGQSPNIVSVLLKSGQLATMEIASIFFGGGETLHRQIERLTTVSLARACTLRVDKQALFLC